MNINSRTKRRKIRNELDMLQHIFSTTDDELVNENNVDTSIDSSVDSDNQTTNLSYDPANAFMPELDNELESEPININIISDQSVSCTSDVSFCSF